MTIKPPRVSRFSTDPPPPHNPNERRPEPKPSKDRRWMKERFKEKK